MQIKKEYKNATFIWDEDSERLEIMNENGTTTNIPKSYIFPLVRFLTRINQRYYLTGLRGVQKREEKKRGI